MNKPALDSPQKVLEYLSDLNLPSLVHEDIYLVTLYPNLTPIARHHVSRGGRAHSALDIVIVLRLAIVDAAHGILLAHNHPSGDPTPSREDREATRKLQEACGIIGLQFIDHLTVARGGAESICHGHRVDLP